MPYYVGMDLHSNNTTIVIINQKGDLVFKAKVDNFLKPILHILKPYAKGIAGVVVESTYNWYWLVDGLNDAGYKLHLANPSANKQYEGIKNTTDYKDALFLANLLRLNILEEGYIYPKEERAVRDLLRKRQMLVQQRTRHILSFQSLYNRQKGCTLRSEDVKKLKVDDMDELFKNEHVSLAAKSNIATCHFLSNRIEKVETSVLDTMKLQPEFVKLNTVPGIGNILGLTISLETGDISRFANVGNFASYCRMVSSQRISNNKKKGENNRKNGNKYLCWAFIEAAHHANRHCPYAQKFFQRKSSKCKKVVAFKALAHKLARASYFIMRDGVDYDPLKAFG